MAKRKIVIGIGVVIALVVASAILWRCNSLSVAMQFADLEPKSITCIEQLSVDSNGDPFSVFQCRTKAGELALVHATKDGLGFWHIQRIKTTTASERCTSIAWVEGAGIRRFSPSDDPVFENEWHFVYCGDDAVQELKFLPGQLPDNSTVNIRQSGAFYIIHLILFSSESMDTETLELRNVLVENGCIRSE